MNKDELIAYWMDKNSQKSTQIDSQAEEINRLRTVIGDESVKWQAHHTDPDKKAYWAAFGKKIHP